MGKKFCQVCQTFILCVNQIDRDGTYYSICKILLDGSEYVMFDPSIKLKPLPPMECMNL